MGDVCKINFFFLQHGHYYAYVRLCKSHSLSKYTLLLEKEEKSVKPNFTARVDGKFISLVSLSKSLIPQVVNGGSQKVFHEAES